MRWNKLLERQLQKHFQGAPPPDHLVTLLEAVNASYNAFERDRELSDRAFMLSETEYNEVNHQLTEELSEKKLSIDQLKEAILALGEGTLAPESEKLPDIVAFLSEQVTKRKVAEESLNTTANRLSALIRNLQSGILLEDEHRQIALTNQFFCDIFGIPLSPDAMIGFDCARMAEKSKHDFKDPDAFLERIDRLLHDKKIVVGEELYLADGRIFERDFIPILIDGLYKGYLWKYRDISKRKRDEARLKASEELWHFALEGAGEGVWQYYLPEREVLISPRHQQLLGFDEDQTVLSPETWMALVHPDDVPIIRDVEQGYATNSLSSHEREYRIRHRAGHYIWILERGMVIRRHPDGRPARIVGTHADITERKRVEDAIRLREAKYRNIIDNMNLGLVEADTEGFIQYANQRFCDMSGYNMEELAGRPTRSLFLPGDPENMVAEKLRLRQKGVSDAYEIAVKNKRGDLRWWLISGAPNYNDTGVLLGSVGIFLDITDRKKLEVELREAREMAEQSSKAKESFLANMSHEIRTPMNAIKGMSTQLRKTLLDDKQRQYLDTIHMAADHLMVVINDILDMSKIQAGMLSLESIGMDPGKAIRHAVDVMEPHATEKGLQLHISLPEGLYPVLMGDPHRLNQVLLNLLSNAVKFTDKGSVEVTCTLLGSTPQSQTLQISVRDTGIGMDAQFLTSLFDQFSQEDKSNARKYGGTGLGMAITRQLVHLMGGDIDVISEKGKGTEVRVTLPFERGNHGDLPAGAEPLTDRLQLMGKRILLAEDNDMNRLVARAALQDYGVDIVEASNGLEAVRLLQDQPFDLVLMDIQMPVMSGLEAIRIIRTELHSDIPVIALTASAIKEEIRQYLQAGMNSYVSKPFEEADLVKAMSGLIGSRQADTPLYHLGKMEKLAGGDPVFIKRLIQLFLDQVPSSIDELHASLLARNTTALRAIAHRLKPAIHNLEIQSLKEVIKVLDPGTTGGPTQEEAEKWVPVLEKGLLQVAEALKKDAARSTL
jgi:PAS domain S-box-containing protein